MEYGFDKIEIQKALNAVKEFFLPKGDKRVLVVSMGVSASAYPKHESVEERVKVEIMFYNPYNYVKVAVRIDNSDDNESKFKIVADHDSCWTDGVKRCMETAFDALDEKFTLEARRKGFKTDEALLEKLETGIHYSKGFSFNGGFKIIEEPNIEKLTDDYDSELETNF